VCCNSWLTVILVGVDLVPIQPDFNILGDRDLKERVHWVHHNLCVHSDQIDFTDGQQ
jgi:hypothetical protein